MRVLISVGKPSSLTIACRGAFALAESGSEKPIAELCDSRLTLALKDGQVEITVDDSSLGSFGVPVLRLTPKTPTAISDLLVAGWKTRSYLGTLEVSIKDRLVVVDELPLEDYVRGVIPAEISPRMNVEAQKALVLSIRTYALKSMESNRHKSSGCHLCDTIDCQGFVGVSRNAPWVDKLIEDTRGQVILHSGKIIAALYSTDCGGITQGNDDAGVGKTAWPYLRPVIDRPRPSTDSEQADPGACSDQIRDYCGDGQYHQWTQIYRHEDLEKAFARYRIGKFQGMEFTNYDASGRVRTVVIRGETGEKRITGSQFRDMFRQNVIKSTRMTLTVTPECLYRIDGKGYGHGLGLCATGANGYAKSDPGVTYVDILKHYYTGVQIATLDGTKVAARVVSASNPTPRSPEKPVSAPAPPPVEVRKPEPPTPVAGPVVPPAPPADAAPTPAPTGGLALPGRVAVQGSR